ncbi:hypothetical protein HJFPF1_12066 [Paramyrothecium foliicola]|nr:hypothetical protein HJFPF1_12066 [Paramyrothecium foliicola]
MRLNIVDFAEVHRDLDTGDPTNFNTNFHNAEEVPGTTLPTEAPYSFERWLPLIMESRGLQACQLQIVNLLPAQARLMVQAAAASVHTKALNMALAEDLEEEVHPAFRHLEFPPEGLFVRFEDCSPKDGAQTRPGKLSLNSVNEIILRLTTSMRACGAISKALSRGSESVKMFFLPFDLSMKTEKEYRVFCMPKSLAVTAISQYRWHRPWIFKHNSPSEMHAFAADVYEGVQEIHGQIMETLQRDAVDDLHELMWSQGFSFDVFYDDIARKCSLVELNTFGAQSGCGSCLFHWVKDRKLLYGEELMDVEFRVAV